MMALSKKDVVFILRHRSRNSKTKAMAELLDLEANRIERMEEKEFEAFARNFVGKTGPNVINKRR